MFAYYFDFAVYFCSSRFATVSLKHYSGRLSSGGASDDEAEYAASRYIPAIKTILEDLATNELSMEDYPSIMPMPDMGPSQGGSAGGGRRGAAGNPARQSRGQAASARKAGGPSNRWSKSSSRQSASSSGPKSFNGGRAIVFMMGGLSYSEMRAAGQVMTKESREIVIGSTAFVSAKEFVEDLATLSEGSD
jgi:syntaxin-binding protein 1